MRVIAGKYRGKKLLSPKDDNVRPTTDRIKETVFNILQFRIEDSRVLDLFCGSGALGIECISRGADGVVFADKSADSIDLTKRNLRGIDGNYRIIASDFLSTLKNVKGDFDIIFIDPPYDGNMGEIAIEKVIEYGLLAEGGVIYFEHASDKTYTPPQGYATRTKPMGYTVAEFITKQTVALMTGSFDPITKGHLAILDEAEKQYGKVVISALVNPDKDYFFNSEQRVAIIKEAVKDRKNVQVIFSTDTAVNVARAVGADVIIRGVRDADDLAYENEMRDYNLSHGGIDTCILTVDGYQGYSSTRAKRDMLTGDFTCLPSQVIPLVQSILASRKNN